MNSNEIKFYHKSTIINQSIHNQQPKPINQAKTIQITNYKLQITNYKLQLQIQYKDCTILPNKIQHNQAITAQDPRFKLGFRMTTRQHAKNTRSSVQHAASSDKTASTNNSNAPSCNTNGTREHAHHQKPSSTSSALTSTSDPAQQQSKTSPYPYSNLNSNLKNIVGGDHVRPPTCAVCWGFNPREAKSELLACTGCGVLVHVNCYGVKLNNTNNANNTTTNNNNNNNTNKQSTTDGEQQSTSRPLPHSLPTDWLCDRCKDIDAQQQKKMPTIHFHKRSHGSTSNGADESNDDSDTNTPAPQSLSQSYDSTSKSKY